MEAVTDQDQETEAETDQETEAEAVTEAETEVDQATGAAGRMFRRIVMSRHTPKGSRSSFRHIQTSRTRPSRTGLSRLSVRRLIHRTRIIRSSHSKMKTATSLKSNQVVTAARRSTVSNNVSAYV